MNYVEYLVTEAEKLFKNSTDVPDKERFLEIYNEFKDFEKVDRDLNLRMHSLYFYMKLYYELSEGKIPSDYEPMVLRGDNTIKKYANVELNFDILIELHEKVHNNQINTRNRLLESRVEVTQKRLSELKALVADMAKDDITIEEYYGSLCIYDHVTHEQHFVDGEEEDVSGLYNE